ncbi:histidine kinase [Mastigocladus laminosus UU774]|nr:histidine kinase [Mastigocladus laminosus UU774]
MGDRGSGKGDKGDKEDKEESFPMNFPNPYSPIPLFPDPQSKIQNPKSQIE